jgi:hypothetical protein
MFYYLQILINKKDKNKDKKIQVATQTYKKWEFTRVSISCLIQGINYCLQINTYWSYIVIIDWQVTYFCWRVKIVSLLGKG